MYWEAGEEQENSNLAGTCGKMAKKERDLHSRKRLEKNRVCCDRKKGNAFLTRKGWRRKSFWGVTLDAEGKGKCLPSCRRGRRVSSLERHKGRGSGTKYIRGGGATRSTWKKVGLRLAKEKKKKVIVGGRKREAIHVV